MSNKQNQTDRAEAMFKSAGKGKHALAEHSASGQAVRDKTARLRALRLAKEAADKPEPALIPPPHAGLGNK
jgi:hypothetical protein